MAAAITENKVLTMNGNGIQSFDLRITNLPLEIEKEGVESLFAEYGQVTGIALFKYGNAKQGYISYSKYCEAEKAINNLNNKPPLQLIVEFKDKNLRNQQIRTEVDLSKPVPDFRNKASVIRCTKVDMSRANCTPHMQPPNYSTDDELLYEVPTNSAIFNPYRNCGPYRETNLMYTRGLAFVSKDGRRHVAHGRGYTYYDIPEPHYEIGTYLQKELERRENGFYEFASEDLEDEVANCTICQTPTPFRCQNCSIVFYCSRPCQLNDWPKHKQECQPLPALVKKVNKTSLQNGHGITPVQMESEIASTSESTQLRRPRTQSTRSETIQPSTSIPAKELRSSVTPEKKVQGTSPASSVKNGSIQRHSKENKNDLFKLSTPANFKTDTASFPSNQQQQQQKPKQPINTTHKPSVSNEEDIVFQSRIFIPKDKFIKVVIAETLSEGKYWVQRVEDEEAINELLCNLRQYIKDAKSVPLEMNVKCIIETDDIYRATILSCENNLAKVFYYDFGTVEYVEIKKVWPINGFEEIPSFARQIQIADDSDPNLLNLGTLVTLLVKATSITQDGVIIVQAQFVSSPKEESAKTSIETMKTPVEKIEQQMANCSFETKASKSSSPSQFATESEKLAHEKLVNFSNVIDHVQIGQKGLLLTCNQLGVYEYSATVVPENAMDDFMLRLCDELKEKSLEYKSNFKPEVGDLVSGLATDESWFRGVVLSNSPIVRIALIDESRVIAPVKCVPLPKTFENLYAMGVVVEFPQGIVVPKGESFNFTITELSNSVATLTVKLDDNSFESTVTIKKWNPRSEQKGLLVPQLLSGHQVSITDFQSQNSIHVQSLEASEKDRSFKLHQEIAKYSLNKKPVSKIPVVGTIVLANYAADGNYYRAIVTKIENQKALIKYIDYGNQEIVTKDKLFVLSDILKEHPSCAAEVSLKNVDKNVPLTEDATVYMQEFIVGEVPLICTFDGNPLENGVILKSTTTNEIINDKMNLLLKPTWKQDKVEEDITVYGIADLPSLKLGDIGDAVKAVFLCYYPDIGIIFFGPNDLDAVTAIQVHMAEQIANYVQATPDHYIPRDNELCIAKYMGEFYRAMCIESSATATESRIFFVDYCNTELVNHKDIRIFTKDFCKIEAYGVMCNISSVVPPEKFNSTVSEKINEILVPTEIYEIKIISLEEDGTFNIDIPALRLELMQKNLI